MEQCIYNRFSIRLDQHVGAEEGSYGFGKTRELPPPVSFSGRAARGGHHVPIYRNLSLINRPPPLLPLEPPSDSKVDVPTTIGSAIASADSSTEPIPTPAPVLPPSNGMRRSSRALSFEDVPMNDASSQTSQPGTAPSLESSSSSFSSSSSTVEKGDQDSVNPSAAHWKARAASFSGRFPRGSHPRGSATSTHADLSSYSASRGAVPWRGFPSGRGRGSFGVNRAGSASLSSIPERIRTVRSFSFDSGTGGSNSSFGDLGSGDFSEHMDVSGEEMLQEPRSVEDGQSSPETIAEGDVIGVGFDQETLEVSLITIIIRVIRCVINIACI